MYSALVALGYASGLSCVQDPADVVYADNPCIDIFVHRLFK